MGDTVKIRATTEWMSRKYNEMNKLLFHGELGNCDFTIFTTGRGSQGRTLGWFTMNGKNLKAKRYDRKLYQDNWYSGKKTYVSKENFYEVCKPMIGLNGHYSGTEDSLLATLVHEMCHYYTYMYGYLPKQAHGREFREIGEIVSSRSNGAFTIQRLASAEEMKGYELDADMQAKRDKRLVNKKGKAIVILVFKKDGSIELSLTASEQVKDEIIQLNTREKKQGISRSRDIVEKIIVSNDARLVELFFGLGFKRLFRTYRFWTIDPTKLGGSNFVEKGGYDYQLVYNDGDEDISNMAASNTRSNEPIPSRARREVFSIKTKNGVVEIPFNGDYDSLKLKLMERFPKMSDESIMKIMNNKSNYKVMENKNIGYQSIIENVIREYFENEFEDDSIEITPNMNLGKFSPLEI